MGDFQVDPEEIITCRNRLADIHRKATDILTLAEDANPEWYIWGLIGAPAAAVYWAYADDIYQHLALMGEVLQDRVEALDCTAQAYKQNEEQIAKALKAIQDLLD
ncbi:hypothetical protein ABGB16_07040 [Micromonospora sp. B11E3]|uniref:hypothetical protein n=1 Tax=Micromonospora sp. B11E3 TaxID=3153562 RepID=UPI00325F8C07